MSGRVRLSARVVVALLAACVVLVGAAAGAGWLVGRNMGSGQPAAAPIPAPPSPPVEPPYRHYQYMSGVSVGDVVGVVGAQGFACQGSQQYGQYLQEWLCRRTSGSLHGTVAVQARDDRHIWLIQAEVDDGGQPASPTVVKPLFAGLAALPVRGDAAASGTAAGWVDTTLAVGHGSIDLASLHYAIADVGGSLLTISGSW